MIYPQLESSLHAAQNIMAGWPMSELTARRQPVPYKKFNPPRSPAARWRIQVRWMGESGQLILLKDASLGKLEAEF